MDVCVLHVCMSYVNTRNVNINSSWKKGAYVLQGVLSPPQPLGSSLLLPRPWALLLRLLLQQGVPEHLLQQLTQPSLGDESALESAVWALFPQECQKAWHAAPHRMATAEAQVTPQPATACTMHLLLFLMSQNLSLALCCRISNKDMCNKQALYATWPLQSPSASCVKSTGSQVSICLMYTYMHL